MTTTTTTTTCPACASDNVLHRGGPHRQCARCRWRFEMKADGGTTGLLERHIAAKRRRGRHK